MKPRCREGDRILVIVSQEIKQQMMDHFVLG